MNSFDDVMHENICFVDSSEGVVSKEQFEIICEFLKWPGLAKLF